jgi:hypothetical protein
VSWFLTQREGFVASTLGDLRILIAAPIDCLKHTMEHLTKNNVQGKKKVTFQKKNLRGHFFGSSTLVCWGKSTNYNTYIYIYAAYICRLYPNNTNIYIHIYSIYIPLNILSIIYTLIYRFLVRTGSRILRSLGACWGKQHRWPPQLPGPQWDWNISNLFSKTWGWVKTYCSHISGNKHPWTSTSGVPRYQGFDP